MSLAIAAIYIIRYQFDIPGIESLPEINFLLFFLFIFTPILCLVSYFRPPKQKFFGISIGIFLFLIASIAWLIFDTGKSTSPYVAIWVLLGIFSSIFGVSGWLPLLAIDSVFLANEYMSGSMTVSTVVLTVIAGLIPIILSALIWRNKSKKDEEVSEGVTYKNLASELNEVANESEVVINAIGDGVIFIDSQGVIQLINPAAQEISGWRKQDAINLNYKTVLKLVSLKDEVLDNANDPIQQALNNNQQVRRNDLNLVTNSGKKLNLYLLISPVGEMGQGIIVVFRDITKEKAEEQEQAEFISTASHEMRTPVASIEGYLGLALNPQTATVDERAKDFILKAHGAAEHLGHLFQDLLDVSKSEDGRMANNPSVVNIVPFIQTVVQGLKQKAESKGLRLSYKPIPDDSNEKHIVPDYMVNLDNDHVREIVDNLIDNAIKYTPKGEIVVDVTGDDEHVTLSVQDSGIGIPTEDIPHLFQKFYRVDNEHTHDIGGTGLGLYLCRRLTEMMGGRIWVESAYGSGSTFYVELPRISSEEANQLIEQQKLNLQQIVSTPSPINEAKYNQPIDTQPKAPKLNVVPRGDALTPEQIAEYVSKQSALAKQTVTLPNPPQPTTADSRPQTVTVPTRESTK